MLFKDSLLESLEYKKVYKSILYSLSNLYDKIASDSVTFNYIVCLFSPAKDFFCLWYIGSSVSFSKRIFFIDKTEVAFVLTCFIFFTSKCKTIGLHVFRDECRASSTDSNWKPLGFSVDPLNLLPR